MGGNNFQRDGAWLGHVSRTEESSSPSPCGEDAACAKDWRGEMRVLPFAPHHRLEPLDITLAALGVLVLDQGSKLWKEELSLG